MLQSVLCERMFDVISEQFLQQLGGGCGNEYMCDVILCRTQALRLSTGPFEYVRRLNRKLLFLNAYVHVEVPHDS